MEQIFVQKEFLIIFLVLLLWVLPWKGYALWLAARNNHKGWFIALLVLNTLAILEIVYIFAIGRKTARINTEIKEISS